MSNNLILAKRLSLKDKINAQKETVEETTKQKVEKGIKRIVKKITKK